MKNYQTHNLNLLVWLVAILFLQGCEQPCSTPVNSTQASSQEASLERERVKRKKSTELTLVAEKEEVVEQEKEKKKREPSRDEEGKKEKEEEKEEQEEQKEEKACGCSRTFQAYSSFFGGSYSYHTCAYHQKKEQEESSEKQRIANEHKRMLETITTKNFVPIKQAIEKYRTYSKTSNSDNYIRETLQGYHVLEITKKSNRWVCSKERLDAVDFSLLEGRVETTTSTMWGSGWREKLGK